MRYMHDVADDRGLDREYTEEVLAIWTSAVLPRCFPTGKISKSARIINRKISSS
jgi:hypothetical protein